MFDFVEITHVKLQICDDLAVVFKCHNINLKYKVMKNSKLFELWLTLLER